MERLVKASDINPHAAPGWDVRLMRLFIVGALVLTAVWSLQHLLGVRIPEENKLEVGLLLGWLIAKSGTVIDWLFGGSESGGRRNDMNAVHAAAAPPILSGSTPPSLDAAAGARQTAAAADAEAEEIAAQAGPRPAGDGM